MPQMDTTKWTFTQIELARAAGWRSTATYVSKDKVQEVIRELTQRGYKWEFSDYGNMLVVRW